MSTKLYVSNLPLSATAEMLITRFCKFGCVVSVAFEPVARASRRGAFVEMDSSSAAHKAIAALNLSDLDGRLISVFLALSIVPTSAA
jgi:RNA recognition motif-containing protein